MEEYLIAEPPEDDYYPRGYNKIDEELDGNLKLFFL